LTRSQAGELPLLDSYTFHSKRGQVKNFNRAAIVTGAAQGIGRRTAELLAENGYPSLWLICARPLNWLMSFAPHGSDVLSFRGDSLRPLPLFFALFPVKAFLGALRGFSLRSLR
jgi:hypothetical protein